MKRGLGKLVLLVIYISIFGISFCLAQDILEKDSQKKKLYVKQEIIEKEDGLIWADVFKPGNWGAELWLFDTCSLEIDVPAILPKEYISQQLEEQGIADITLVGDTTYVIPFNSAADVQEGREQLVSRILEFIDSHRSSLKISEKHSLSPLIKVDIFPMPEWELTYQNGEENIEILVLSTKKDMDGKIKAIMEISHRELGEKSRCITTLELWYPYLVSAKTMVKGEPITPNKVTQRFLETPASWGKPLRTSDLTVIVTANRKILPGTVLTSNHCTKEKMVRAGSDVIIYHQKGGVQIKLTGRAYESGILGEHIKVKPRNAKRYIKGEVIGRGEVMVYVP